ncbi:transposase [Pseudomonas sp. B21-048]|uniref:transposase n=1 Tax=Pseudomonas sp. B21-048 TaxID=2895490 RepID=UPI00215EA418
MHSAYCRATLQLQANKYACEIHAWCLMTNHVHLLISPHEHGSASSLMKGIGLRYVQYINRTYGGKRGFPHFY